MTPETETASALASELGVWIDRLFPDADRGARLKRALEERNGGDARAVTDDLCREIEAVAHDFSRHFALEYFADGSLVPDTEPPGWPSQEACELRLRAGSVREVTRHRDGVGVLALDGHDGVHIAAPYVEAAFALLRGARGVVLDLRRNQGGDRGSVMLVLDWLLGGEPTHICDVIYRDRTRQWWTTGRLGTGAATRDAGQRAGRRAYVLVGRSARVPPSESRKSQARRATDAGCWLDHHSAPKGAVSQGHHEVQRSRLDRCHGPGGFCSRQGRELNSLRSRSGFRRQAG